MYKKLFFDYIEFVYFIVIKEKYLGLKFAIEYLFILLMVMLMRMNFPVEMIGIFFKFCYFLFNIYRHLKLLKFFFCVVKLIFLSIKTWEYKVRFCISCFYVYLKF